MSGPAPGGVVVRRVGPEAAERVLAVITEAFGDRPALDPPAEALAEDLDSVRAALAGDGGLLATDPATGEPLGSTLLRARPDGLALQRFGVVRGARGRGVAGALVEAAVETAIGFDALVVTAREELPATIRFWEAQGFVETDRHPPCLELRRALPTTWDAPDAEAMRTFGERVGRSLRAGDLLVLTGELGAGKTTFTQGVGRGLGVRGDVTSPTFVIARVHPSLVGGPALVHVDAYRLGGVDELDDLDLDTSLDEAVTVVEWGEGLAEGLAESRLEVVIRRALADADVEDHDPRTVAVRRVVPPA